MDVDAIQKALSYTNADESETREIRQFLHRDGKDFVRYRYHVKLGWGGEGWMTKAQFAEWAHHVTPFHLPPRVRQSSRRRKGNTMSWRGDFDLDD